MGEFGVNIKPTQSSARKQTSLTELLEAIGGPSLMLEIENYQHKNLLFCQYTRLGLQAENEISDHPISLKVPGNDRKTRGDLEGNFSDENFVHAKCP